MKSVSSAISVIKLKKKCKNAAQQTDYKIPTNSENSSKDIQSNNKGVSVERINKSISKFWSSKKAIDYDISDSSYKEVELFKCITKYEHQLHDLLISSTQESSKPISAPAESTDNDILVTNFTRDLIEEEKRTDEQTFHKRWRKYIPKQKAMSSQLSGIIIQEELEQKIEFTSLKLPSSKHLNRKATKIMIKNRRMYSAPQSIKDIQQSEISESYKDITNSSKLNQKMIIGGWVYTLSELIDLKLEKNIVADRIQWKQAKLPSSNINQTARNSFTKKPSKLKQTSEFQKKPERSRPLNRFGTSDRKSIQSISDETKFFGKLINYKSRKVKVVVDNLGSS